MYKRTVKKRVLNPELRPQQSSEGNEGDEGDGGHLDLPRLRSVTRSVCQMGEMGSYLNTESGRVLYQGYYQ
jgi:hypothetical protein